MTENDKILLLAQLVDNLSRSFNEFENSYDSADKKKFDIAKEALLESQNKISLLLNQK